MDSLIRFAETTALDGPGALRPEDSVEVRALVRLEMLNDGHCEDASAYRKVLTTLREAKMVLRSRREEEARVAALAGGQRE